MKEEFEWVENGDLQVGGAFYNSKCHSKIIYDEGGHTLKTNFKMGPGENMSLVLIANPRPPPMLNLRLKVIRLGFMEPNQPNGSLDRNMIVKQFNLNDEKSWMATIGCEWIDVKEKLRFCPQFDERLYYEFSINFTFVKPRSFVKPSVIPMVAGPALQDLLTHYYGKMRDETSDFKIVCQGEELKCHKLILSLRSDFFKKMFNRDCKESNEGIMTTTDFTGKTMRSFLKYLYTDSIDQVEIDCDLLRAAHLYDFKKLISECVRGLSMKINDDNVKEMLQIALMLELPTLLEEAKKKMKEKLQNWIEKEIQKRKDQVNQLLGSLKLGQDLNLDMEGFNDQLKIQLTEYLETQKK